MVCFCHASASAVAQVLLTLEHGAAAPVAQGAAEQRVVSVSNWLAARLLPSAPWQPDPAWLTLELPVPRMEAAAIATITSIATLRTLAMEVFGADPFRPGTAAALARVVVTLNARLPAGTGGSAAALRTEGLSLATGAAAAGRSAPAGSSAPSAASAGQRQWSSLANVAEASARVRQAVSAGLFSLPAAQMQAYLAPGGVPMAQWGGLLSRLAPLLPLVAASAALGPELSDPANLAEAMRQVRSLAVPPLADPGLVAQLTATFAAVGRVQSATGLDPMRTPFEDVRRQVAEGAALAAAAIPAGAQPPRVALNPALLAPPAVVATAMSPEVARLAALAWRVPPANALPALAHLLPAASLMKVLPAGASVRKQPCAQGCDAAALMRAAGV